MSDQPTAVELTRDGIAALKQGDRTQAYQLLKQATELAPHNQDIWLWFADAATDDIERRDVLAHVVQLNSQSKPGQIARRKLELMDDNTLHILEGGNDTIPYERRNQAAPPPPPRPSPWGDRITGAVMMLVLIGLVWALVALFEPPTETPVADLQATAVPMESAAFQDAPPINEIRNAAVTLEDGPWLAYAESLQGRKVIGWSGQVIEVRPATDERVQVVVVPDDTAPADEMGLVRLDMAPAAADGLAVGQRLRFSGAIAQVVRPDLEIVLHDVVDVTSE